MRARPYESAPIVERQAEGTAGREDGREQLHSPLARHDLNGMDLSPPEVGAGGAQTRARPIQHPMITQKRTAAQRRRRLSLPACTACVTVAGEPDIPLPSH